MSNQYGAASWYGPEMRHADRSLDAAIDEAAAAIRASDELIAELDANEKPATEEEIEEFRALVTGRCRTPEWDAVLERISRGELTWRDLVEGRAAYDPEVQAAFTSMRSIPPLDPLTATGEASIQAEASQSQPETSDDDYFDDFDVFER